MYGHARRTSVNIAMRIGYLTYGLDRSPTGIGRYAVELLRALAALPNAPEIVLLTTEQCDPYGLWQQFEHVPLPGCRLLPALLTVGHATVAQAVRQHKLNIVHDPNGIAPFFGPRSGARRIVTIHDAFAFVHPELHNHLDNWRYRSLLKWAVRQTDVVLTDSNHSRRDLERYLRVPAAKVRTIPCGFDPRYSPVPDHHTRQGILDRYGLQQPYLLYVGGINARKNIARLFEAFASVRRRHPELKLVIGGKRQWQTGAIDATFRRLDLHEAVHFTGYVDDPDLPALYRAAEAFVFPSLYEGFGLPPLEAMACGTPVITSNTSSLPEVVGDAALTIDPYNIEALAAAIERVLTDAALRHDLRQRGFVQAQRFSWQQTAQQTLAVYHSTLSGNIAHDQWITPAD